MSSGFVSGGTDQHPIARDSAWLKAQQEVEAQRRAKQDEAARTDGKSLYDVLQANKAAKQEAFEESIRLKNQFRALEEDEVEFLDSVLESTRAKEDAVKQETAEQLDAFRKQREAAEQSVLDETSKSGSSGPAAEEGTWATKKRRRRDKVPESTVAAKIRRVSTSDEGRPDTRPAVGKGKSSTTNVPAESGSPKTQDSFEAKKTDMQLPAMFTVPPVSNPETKTGAVEGLGLGAYSSDED